MLSRKILDSPLAGTSITISQAAGRPTVRPTDRRHLSSGVYSILYLSCGVTVKQSKRVFCTATTTAAAQRDRILWLYIVPFETRALVVFVLSISVRCRSSRSKKEKNLPLRMSKKKKERTIGSNGSGKPAIRTLFGFPISISIFQLWCGGRSLYFGHTPKLSHTHGAHTKLQLECDERETNSMLK